jgi:imidazoleglycerol-phosphate dehydratase/histidinol-phosphatase
MAAACLRSRPAWAFSIICWTRWPVMEKWTLRSRAAGIFILMSTIPLKTQGLALGEAFAKLLTDKRGLERYGFALPMDEAEAKVLIDFGGRNWLVWNAEFKREKIGEMPTEMFFHFFKSFSDAAKCNLNIECKGENEHHKIEAIFKAFAKAIRMAVKRDPFSNYLPSTKGVL